jgi:hypothetical protein
LIKELSMKPIPQALLLACAVLAVAVLAVFDIVPEAFAQYAPLVAVPFIVRSGQRCRALGKGGAA